VCHSTDLFSKSAGGDGYLRTDRVSKVRDFTASVGRIAAGGRALDPTLPSFPSWSTSAAITTPSHELTPRARSPKLARELRLSCGAAALVRKP
jgi:hypothetical protein